MHLAQILHGETTITFAAMGTLVTVSWRSAPQVAEVLRVSLPQRVEQLEDDLSRFRADSPVSRMNTEWINVGPHCAAVFRAAQDWSQRTRGFFKLFPCLGLGAETLQLRGEQARLTEGVGAGSLDLGGIAKGYAAAHLASLIAQSGGSDVLVSFGGSSIVAPNRRAIIRVQSPWTGREFLGNLQIENESLSFSALPQTDIVPSLVRSHIRGLDGQLAFTDICAALVVGPDAMSCEALSTALIAGGTPLLHDLTQKGVLGGAYRALAMTSNGRVFADPELQLSISLDLPEPLPLSPVLAD
ncbi:FAD:protein FMN transferase [Mobiluncus sp.]|uniref:FAD:protein FMN transferase n=1 Tax=Mobiluncus sp. TaxID=47293 RepID=UPI002A917031|nr:FAD:protein FMN transferase [Mobiluncus sp.]MDY6077576.1 FAD:protein FMN transferase [Mobiluncus sp.]